MSARSQYLLRLAVICQLADERAQAHPDDRMSCLYAEAVRLLFLDAIEQPEGHALFDSSLDGQAAEVAIRTDSALACPTA